MTAVVVAGEHLRSWRKKETGEAGNTACYNVPAGHLWGMHVPDYLLFVAYGLFAVGVIACLAFVARNFEDEDPQPRSKRGR